MIYSRSESSKTLKSPWTRSQSDARCLARWDWLVSTYPQMSSGKSMLFCFLHDGTQPEQARWISYKTPLDGSDARSARPIARRPAEPRPESAPALIRHPPRTHGKRTHANGRGVESLVSPRPLLSRPAGRWAREEKTRGSEHRESVAPRHTLTSQGA